MTEPMQRPDHEASRWPRDSISASAMPSSRNCLSVAGAAREEPTADA
ncbi:hypothetical protein P4237_31715 [Pseudomonas aeruginosa]|nr:hypothetical protein [Pseudomonas aeruginosa]